MSHGWGVSGTPAEITWAGALIAGLPETMHWPEEIRKGIPNRPKPPLGKPPFCTDYEQARQIYNEGELQAWDGNRWEDIPAGLTPFFSRRPEEYRRRPHNNKELPPYMVYTPGAPDGQRAKGFQTPDEVALHPWGKDVAQLMVFKRIDLEGYDIAKYKKQLEGGQ
jgi:hypothetical protein